MLWLNAINWFASRHSLTSSLRRPQDHLISRPVFPREHSLLHSCPFWFANTSRLSECNCICCASWSQESCLEIMLEITPHHVGNHWLLIANQSIVRPFSSRAALPRASASLHTRSVQPVIDLIPGNKVLPKLQPSVHHPFIDIDWRARPMFCRSTL
jgi:hypothetical protein